MTDTELIDAIEKRQLSVSYDEETHWLSIVDGRMNVIVMDFTGSWREAVEAALYEQDRGEY